MNNGEKETKDEQKAYPWIMSGIAIIGSVGVYYDNLPLVVLMSAMLIVKGRLTYI